MPRWSRAQVESFAPDERSIAAARKLARPGPWSETGSTDTLVWGKCQGSGRTPYQVSVDLTGPAAKCTCPSRKFPCKHGIALLMLWAESDGAIGDVAEPAGFADEWAKGRADRAARSAERRVEKAAGTDAEPADPEAAAKRLATRLELMTAGAAELETWLCDLHRTGLATTRRRGYAFWEDAAARLTDTQLPGLAQRVRDIPSLLHGDDWADVLLAETGCLYAAARAWQRRDGLGVDDFANLRAFVGWVTPTDEVRATEHIRDTWVVIGAHRNDDGRLVEQRTWIHGRTTGRLAVVLDFGAGSAPVLTSHLVGSVIETPVALYPGSGTRRALFVEAPTADETAVELPPATSIATALAGTAELIAANPFADRHPLLVNAAVVVDEQAGAAIVDERGDALPIISDGPPWQLLAITGGHEVDLFGELEAGRFRPLTVAVGGELVPV